MEMETRMALIEQAYENLDKRLTSVEQRLDDVRLEMAAGKNALIKVIIGSTGTIIAGIASVIVTIVIT
jgi:tetrahydromethanopterin S-methyltransferase subunit G